MAHAISRRDLLGGLATAGIVGLSGCNGGGSSSGGGGNGGRTTREPLTWTEATREVLDESELEVLRSAGVDPGSIESRSDAERAFTLVGWHRSVTGLDAERLRTITTLIDRAAGTERTLSDIESTLTDLDGTIRTMKETDIPLAGSVWEAAVGLAPSLEGFDVAVDESLDEVRTWLELLNGVTENLEATVGTIEDIRNGQVEGVSTLPDRIDRSLSAIGELESRSSSLRQDISEYAETTGEVADVADQLGPLAGDVGTVFGEASTRLAEAESELQQFNDQLRTSRSVLSSIESDSQQAAGEWLSRAEELTG